MTTDAARYLAARNLRDAILTRPTHGRNTMPTSDDLRRQAADLLREAEQLDTQADEAELAAMSPAQINKARRDGRLKDLLGQTST